MPPRTRRAGAALVLLVASCGAGCRQVPPPAPGPLADPPSPPAPPAWSIAIHGGAGTLDPREIDAEAYYAALQAALAHGADLLDAGEASLEVVEKVVRLLEDDPKFNAGRGAVFTSRGTHELDAAIMDGRTLSCGAVTGVKNVRNPVTLARKVMERSPHVFLAGTGADEFAREVGVERVQQSYFFTRERHQEWREAVRAEEAKTRRPARADPRARTAPPSLGTGNPGSGTYNTVSGSGTVGAVALDRYGNLAAATSTGGMTNKRFGRVGDVPVVGAGTYADNATAAISCTGKGEEFIRHTVAHDVSARMRYAGAPLGDAARTVIHEVLKAGDGGLIAVAADGEIALEHNTPGMLRGAADARGRFEVGIWRELRSGRAAADNPAAEIPAADNGE